MTVRRHVVVDGWTPHCSPELPGLLAGREAWLAGRFRRHRSNADVVRQERAGELGIAACLRAAEPAVACLRQELAAQALARVRFETPPGRRLQVGFGERGVRTGGEAVQACLFAATLGRAPRGVHHAGCVFARSAMSGGRLVLPDNAKALADHRDADTRVGPRGSPVEMTLSAPPRLCLALGRATGCPRAASRPDEGQGQEGRGPRQAQCHCRPGFRALGGVGGEPGLVNARGGGSADARHGRRGAGSRVRA